MGAEGQANRLSQAGDARACVRLRVRVHVRGRVRVRACVRMRSCSSSRLLACKRLVRLFELREGRLFFLLRGGPVGPLMQPRDERHRLGHARLGIRGCGGIRVVQCASMTYRVRTTLSV